jgi:hypothetical protein
MMRLFFFILFLFPMANAIDAQQLSNSLCGTYTCPGSAYETFSFYGNGKLLISTSLIPTKRDYFQIDDSLIVYPDISEFKFLVQKDGSLKGISNWVKDSIWMKINNDSIVCSQPIAPAVNRKMLESMFLYNEAFRLSANGKRTEADYSRAISLLKTSCDSGYGRACNALGSALLFKEGEEKTREVWEKGCKLGYSDCCKNLGDIFKGKNDLKQAAIYYKMACDLGNVEACAWDFETKLKAAEHKPSVPVKKAKSGKK